ncbi:hypothetical protein BDF14DRAFT_1293578 [Spinellus fusiger]|nr:hypothetical protein BDF14DRAFT_1293578 [Spinellus fusiger]
MNWTSEEEEEEDMSEEEEDSEEEEQPKPPVSHTKRKKQRTVHSPAEESETEVVENRPLTKRQRARLNDDETGDYFMELPMDNGRKKILTEEEEALQKSEVARRRKNQSIQRAEKDKDDTINRLLKKQASKKRLRNKIDPNRLHYVTNQHGSQLSIPAAWTIEQVFSSSPPPPSVHRQLLCEVEGCNKAKKYTCKKSTKAVCSLDHYQVMEA